MKIIVCGAGLVGRNISRYLASEGNEVTIVDKDPALVREMTDLYDMRGVTGFASHPDVLDEAGARDADMIIAATYSDEVNMVICQVAHSIFDITDKIARLRAESYTRAIYADMYRRDHLPVDVVISPERSVAKSIARRVRKPGAFDSKPFFEHKVQLLGIHADENCPIVNTQLKQLSELFSTFNGIIVGIRRDDKLFVPGAEDEIYYGDDVYLFTTSEDEPRAYEIFGKLVERLGHIVLIGGGDIGYGIVKILEEESDNRIKVIENDQKRAEELADLVNRSIVLKGDGLDPHLLQEANIARADAVLAVTNDDKVNLLSAARGKSMGAGYAIAVVNETGFEDLAATLDIDSLVNPRAITVSSILQHVRHGRIHDVYVVGDNEGEVLEIEVLATSNISGKAIRDIDWPEGARVGAIYKDEDVEIASADTRLEEGDWVTIFALRESVAAVERLFQVTIDYF